MDSTPVYPVVATTTHSDEKMNEKYRIFAFEKKPITDTYSDFLS